MPELTAYRLREVLDYDAMTGIFSWKVSTTFRVKVGQVAGGSDGHGYLRIAIDGRKHLSHRLAWLYQTGAWPRRHIDHINGTKTDNRFANLREATRSQNMSNRGKLATNTSGFKGVTRRHDEKRWRAQIKVHGKIRNLGRFNTPEEAHAAYGVAAKKYHGEFSNVGSGCELSSAVEIAEDIRALLSESKS